jgi:hypothetical protein
LFQQKDGDVDAALHWGRERALGDETFRWRTPEVGRPVPSRPSGRVALGPKGLARPASQPERRKLPRRPPATSYAAAWATGSGEAR